MGVVDLMRLTSSSSSSSSVQTVMVVNHEMLTNRLGQLNSFHLTATSTHQFHIT